MHHKFWLGGGVVRIISAMNCFSAVFMFAFSTLLSEIEYGPCHTHCYHLLVCKSKILGSAEQIGLLSWQLAPAPDCSRCQAKCQSHNSAPITAIFSLPTPHSTLSVGNDNVKVEYRWNGSAIRPALYMDHLWVQDLVLQRSNVFTTQDEINVLLLMEEN